jgi:hypothetical protein
MMMKPITYVFLAVTVAAMTGCGPRGGQSGLFEPGKYKEGEVEVFTAKDPIPRELKEQCLKKRGIDIDKVDRTKHEIAIFHGIKHDGTREFSGCGLAPSGMERALISGKRQ